MRHLICKLSCSAKRKMQICGQLCSKNNFRSKVIKALMKTVSVAGFLLWQNIAVMFACDHYFKQITFSRPSCSLACALFWIAKCRKAEKTTRYRLWNRKQAGVVNEFITLKNKNKKKKCLYLPYIHTHNLVTLLQGRRSTKLCWAFRRSPLYPYSKKPKSGTSFKWFTFFHADINQSEVEDGFQLASDWINSARKNVNKSKAVTLLGSLL